MMFQGPSRNCCSLLAVVCGQNTFDKKNQVFFDYPVPELVSSGFLQVQVLTNPSADEFRRTLVSAEPDILYLQGEQIDEGEKVGFPRWGDANSLSPEGLCGLFGLKLPSTVYLEFPDSKKLAEALHSKGVPYVIFWRSSFSLYAALHFRQALFSVIQSSLCHIFDAFQLARASFWLYCMRETIVDLDNEEASSKVGPHILGDPPVIDVSVPKSEDQDDEENMSENVAAVKVYVDDISLKFLVCGLPSTLDACLLSSWEDGLNALLNIEIRGSKLFNRTSTPTPALQAGAVTRGIVTMRCDISTCSSSYISLVVSGNADTCFSDQLLENHIKNELIESDKVVNVSSSSEKHQVSLFEPRKSASIACGANVSEICVKVPMWASQVLRQLAVDVSYRSLVMLGIASIQGLSIASFEKDDAKRLLFFYKQGNQFPEKNGVPMNPPLWFIPPPPSHKRSKPREETKTPACNGLAGKNGVNFKRVLNIAAMRPIPHTRRHKILPVSALFPVPENYNGDQVKHNVPIPPAKHTLPTSVTNRKSQSSSHQAKLIASLNSLPLKKHSCSRAPIQVCSEEEFLRDLMQFLILRGHTRLVPRGGLAEFPDAILNATRLDLFNLYREVVSRGGFNVGNGINWKGQVFSKMRNHTLTNRMTGVGNTLKRHYETYLLEYELAHDDVDGECCLLCKSSAAGDWVNCGMCDEWAHFGCDRRQGLGAFKDYAKTDGLEYICPKCSSTNIKKKSQRSVDKGFSKSQRLF